MYSFGFEIDGKKYVKYQFFFAADWGCEIAGTCTFVFCRFDMQILLWNTCLEVLYEQATVYKS